MNTGLVAESVNQRTERGRQKRRKAEVKVKVKKVGK
jgi:hypothetical protein